MIFLWPLALFSLILVPVAVFGYLRWNVARSGAVATTLGSGYVDVGARKWTRHISPVLALLALIALLIGFARPQATINVPRFRSTIVLAFDISQSMAAEDLEPTRLEAAKIAALEFVENQPDSVDIGVVSFGSLGAITLRPTEERNEIVAAINRLEPAGETNLSEGLFAALSAIADDPIIYLPDEDGNVEIPDVDFGSFGSSIVVLFSDGEDTTEIDPLPLAELGAQGGIRTYTVGVGTLDGTTLDIDGFSVASALNEESLMAIAEQSNGEYFLAEEQADLTAAAETIERDLTIEEERIEISSLFAISGIAFLAFAAVASIVSQRRLP